MATKVTVFGQNKTDNKELNPIELVKVLYGDGKLRVTSESAKHFDNVELIEPSGQTGDYDIINAWDNDWDKKFTYLGHWNDGVVEGQ